MVFESMVMFKFMLEICVINGLRSKKYYWNIKTYLGAFKIKAKKSLIWFIFNKLNISNLKSETIILVI